jgi:hypothetical protein
LRPIVIDKNGSGFVLQGSQGKNILLAAGQERIDGNQQFLQVRAIHSFGAQHDNVAALRLGVCAHTGFADTLYILGRKLLSVIGREKILDPLPEVGERLQSIALPHGDEQVARADVSKVLVGPEEQLSYFILLPLSAIPLFKIQMTTHDPPIGTVSAKLEIM